MLVSDCTWEVRYMWFVAEDEMPHTLADRLLLPNHVEFVNTTLGTEEAKSVDTLTHDRDTPTNKTSHFRLLNPQVYYLAAWLVHQWEVPQLEGGLRFWSGPQQGSSCSANSPSLFLSCKEEQTSALFHTEGHWLAKDMFCQKQVKHWREKSVNFYLSFQMVVTENE